MNGGEIPEGVEIEQVWAIEAEYAPDGEARRRPVRHEVVIVSGVAARGGHALGKRSTQDFGRRSSNCCRSLRPPVQQPDRGRDPLRNAEH